MRRINLRLAIRHLLKTRGFTALNILGLTLGLTTFLLIVLYVADECSYDRWNSKAARIYRVNTDLNLNQHVSYMADAAPPVAPTLIKNYPEVQKAVRLLPQPGTRFKKGDQLIAEPRVVICDPQIFDVFTLPMVEGNPATALQSPHTVVLTESTARRYFNTTSVIGRTLNDVDDSAILTVTGVIRDMPAQSSFHYDLFISMRGNSMEGPNNSFYALFPMATFILLRPGADVNALRQQLGSFMYKWERMYKEYESKDYSLRLGLTPLTDIHLRSNRSDELEANGNIQYVYIFSAIAVFVLLIAAINFMNLSTAHSAGRSREVGVRKVLGSARSMLIAQFLSESMLMTLAAAILAIGLAVAILPFFNQLAGKSLSFNGQVWVWLLPCLVGIVLVVGLMAGAYPAFFLSAFRPVEVLKGQLTAGFKGGVLRSTLVVFQFSISLFLIIGTLVVFRQLRYIQSRNLGFDRSRVLVIKGTTSLPDPRILKKEVLQLPGVAAATLSDFLPTNNIRWHNFGSAKGGTDISIEVQSWMIDPDYISTLKMQIVTGRDFSSRFATDSTGIVLNETAARVWGIAKDPLNKLVTLNGYNHGNTAFHVIGVVKDFNFSSLRANITPLTMIIANPFGSPNLLDVRVKSDNLPALLAQIKTKWKSLAPHQPFEYSFMDADFDALYRSEQRMGQLSILFSTLAIAIACLGLFGLAAYAAERRTKEIGIRKVLGANVTGIVALLSSDFLRLIAIAIIIASPLAWFGANRWLQNFAYRTTISVWLFVLAGGLVLLIAIATTIIQSVRAALANPVDSLRAE
jgi:putative ABC transport system permease protein